LDKYIFPLADVFYFWGHLRVVLHSGK